MNLRRFFLTASLTAMMAGCATGPAPQSLADTLAADPSLSTLHGLVTKAGLSDTLKGAGPFTVFAPCRQRPWKTWASNLSNSKPY